MNVIPLSDQVDTAAIFITSLELYKFSEKFKSLILSCHRDLEYNKKEISCLIRDNADVVKLYATLALIMGLYSSIFVN